MLQRRDHAAWHSSGEKRPLRPGVWAAMLRQVASESPDEPSKSRSGVTDMRPGKAKLKLCTHPTGCSSGPRDDDDDNEKAVDVEEDDEDAFESELIIFEDDEPMW